MSKGAGIMERRDYHYEAVSYTHLDVYKRQVEEEVILLPGVLLHGLVQVKEARPGVLLPIPGAGTVEGIPHAALVPGFLRVNHGLHIHPCDLPQAGAGSAHAVGVVEGEAGRRACLLYTSRCV